MKKKESKKEVIRGKIFTLPFTSWSLAMEKRSQQKIVHIDRKATVR